MFPNTNSPFLVAISSGVTNSRPKKERQSVFWPLSHLTTNISLTVRRSVNCQLELNIS